LKRTRIHADTDDHAIHRFEEEARLQSILVHANIAQVFEFFRMGQTYVLVMEYVDGRNLGELLRLLRQKHRTLPLPVCLHIADEVYQGLEYAHDKRDPTTGIPLDLVHRDISPSNIMISSEGAVKLIDFGIAKGTFQRDRTEVGTVKGKLAYMSPEQAMGRPLDRRSDLYSTALVLYELVTGVPALVCETNTETLAKIAEPSIAPARTLRPEIPLALEKILTHALAPDPRDRYANASEIREALHPLLKGVEKNELQQILKQSQDRLRVREGGKNSPAAPTFKDFPRRLKETVAGRAGAVPRRDRR
jgi:serine/threonine-protein kinase